MDNRTVIVIILGIAAVALSYYVYINSSYWQGNVKDVLIDGRQELNSSKFSEDFLKHNCTAIIMDIRGVEDPYRKNILQCGVDLAGSQGLVGMEMQIMGFDEGGCVDENGSKTVQECMQILNKECYIFYITKGENMSTVYEGLLVIGEGDVYFPCMISYSVS
ncbi:MAG: hypothetical protein ACPL06_03440 [Candidatus Anstonellales archaeon]